MAGNSGGPWGGGGGNGRDSGKEGGRKQPTVGKINLKAVIPYHLKLMTCFEKDKSNFAF